MTLSGKVLISPWTTNILLQLWRSMDLKGEAGQINTSYGPITSFLKGGK